MALCSIGKPGPAPGTRGRSRWDPCLVAGCMILGMALPMPHAGAQSRPAPPQGTVAGQAATGPAAPATTPCTCRAKGRDYELGEVVCLPTSAGPRLATCGMELNNTSWHVTSQPCPDS